MEYEETDEEYEARKKREIILRKIYMVFMILILVIAIVWWRMR